MKWEHRLSFGSLAVGTLLASGHAAAQADYVEKAIRPYRLACKLGSPDLAGLELEALVPGLGHHLGIWISGTYLPVGHDQSETDGVVTEEDDGGFTHFGVGADGYLNGEGSGIYASVGYDRISLYLDVIKTQSGKRSYTNPTHLASFELGYKYIGSFLTYSFFGGYGLNFAYARPDPSIEHDPFIKKGNWILAGFSLGLAFPLTPSGGE